MAKHAQSPTAEGILLRPYEAFYNNPVPIGARCIITNEQEDTYTVKFPDIISYSGSFGMKKVCVQLDG